jgi:hypothetical protein
MTVLRVQVQKGILMLYGPRQRSLQRVTPLERVANLSEALQTADRLRTQRVFMGTMQLWESLVGEANRFLREIPDADDEGARALTMQLEAIVQARRSTFGRRDGH